MIPPIVSNQIVRLNGFARSFGRSWAGVGWRFPVIRGPHDRPVYFVVVGAST